MAYISFQDWEVSKYNIILSKSYIDELISANEKGIPHMISVENRGMDRELLLIGN